MATHISKDVHDIHPSLANLDGTIGLAKQRLSQASTPQYYKVKRVDPAANLQSADLRPFKNDGERNFIILVEAIQLFDDKELTQQTANVVVEKDAVIPGTYLYDDKVVCLGNPYNVYCNAIDVEPQDLKHSHYAQDMDTDNKDEEYVIIDTDRTDTVDTDNTYKQKTETMREINIETDINEKHYAVPAVTDADNVNGAGGHVVQPSNVTIPEIDSNVNRNYPDAAIPSLEEKNESFIQRLPPKQSLFTTAENGSHFEFAENEMNAGSQQQLTGNNMNNGCDNANAQGSNSKSEQSKYFFNDFLMRAVVLATSLLIFCILSFAEWFKKQTITSFSTAFGISAFGIFVVFLGAFGCLFGGMLEMLKISLPHKRYFILFIMAMYVIGGFFYFVGACSVAQAYNSVDSSVSNMAAFAGVWWTEMFYVAMISIITGVDIWKHFIDRWDLRVSIFLSLYIFCGIILSFCLLLTGHINGTYITLGIGYLLSAICAFTFLLLRLLSVTTSKIKTSDKIELSLMICVLILILFIGFTYFAIAASNEITAAETSCYYVGMGIFNICIGIFMTFDITFNKYLIPILC